MTWGLNEMEQPSRRIRLVVAGGFVGPFAVFVAVLFLSRGIGSADALIDGGRPRAATKPIVAASDDPRPTITVRDSAYGRILFDGRGRALYAFTRDPRGSSTCVETCAASWPPYLLRGSRSAGAGVEGSLLDTTTRPNGDRQVTYAGRPLYYWVGDREPGDVGCQNVFEFGGLWLVQRASGRLVRSVS